MCNLQCVFCQNFDISQGQRGDAASAGDDNQPRVELLGHFSGGPDRRLVGLQEHHFDVGASIDIASWDSYPLGFLEDRSDEGAAWKRRFMRQGDPDFQAFHHDLYRAVGQGRWWVMEQQPGPVNWAPWNPAPLSGMARLWAWEGFAHGAEATRRSPI